MISSQLGFESHRATNQNTKGEPLMLYRIEYADGKCRNFANSRKDLLEWLKLLKDETITDIRKIYKSGVSNSVLEKYMKYIK